MSQTSTILVVDDEPLMQETLEGLLFAAGYQLAFANNGAEALAKAQEMRPDLILLDVMMPDMTGFEVCRRLRAHPVLAEVPILMITALDDRESRLKGIKAGADDFIAKPFDSVELQLRVQTITRLNRYRRLLTERNKFEWVVEKDRDGYLMLSATDQYLYANNQARLYLDIPADEPLPLAETFLELVGKRYHCSPQTAWAAWPNPPLVDSPYYLVQAESEASDSFWLQLDLMEMTAQAPERYLIRLHNITGNVMAQKLVWNFHQQVSHKLKTPLTKLIGFLSVLRHSSLTEDEETEMILDRVETSAFRLQEEIMSIFNYMDALDRNEAERLAHCPVAELPHIIERVGQNIDLKSFETNYQNFAQLEPYRLPTSRQNIESLLLELLSNAKKFHPKTEPRVEIKVIGHPEGVRIRVADDGVTLSPEQLVKMWVPYYQAEKYFTGQVPGMGLGLAMVASVVWGIGGQCRAYNREDGPGVVVELSLPVEP